MLESILREVNIVVFVFGFPSPKLPKSVIYLDWHFLCTMEQIFRDPVVLKAEFLLH